LLISEPLQNFEKFVKPHEPGFFSSEQRLFLDVLRHFVRVEDLCIFMAVCYQIAESVGALLDTIAVSETQIFIVADSDFK
jgi:hypothetical protein